jgi:hypothetical protein
MAVTKTATRTTAGMTRDGDEEDKTEEERDKDPRHAYKDPDRSVHNIFGGKVALENGR